MASDLEDTLTSWKMKYGEKRVAKNKWATVYYAISIHERRELLRHLVQTFKNKGKEKEFFKQDRVKNAIAEECFPPVVYDKDSRKRGYQAVWRELREVVSEFWPDEDVTDAVDNIKNENNTTVYDPNVHGRIGKELDRSSLKGAPKPENTIDKEASKLLGFGDE